MRGNTEAKFSTCMRYIVYIAITYMRIGAAWNTAMMRHDTTRSLTTEQLNTQQGVCKIAQ